MLNEKERYIVMNRLMADEPQTLQQNRQAFLRFRASARVKSKANVIRKIRGHADP